MSKISNSIRLAIVAMAAMMLAASIGCSKPPTETAEAQPEPEIINPAIVEPATPEPDVVEPDVIEPDVTEPETTEPDTTQPDVAEPDVTEPKAIEPETTAPLKNSELLVELPDHCNTPDGLCLLPNGDILLAVPNVNSWAQAVAADGEAAKQDPAAVIMRITKDNKLEKYCDSPIHPITGKAFTLGLCIDPEGKNLYLTDAQWFANMANPGNNARVLRIPLDENYNPAGEPVVVVEGLTIANAVIIRDGYLYLSDTTMVPKTDPNQPLISGIFRIKLSEEGTKLTLPLLNDPHLIATIKTYHPTIGFGADGLTFDSKGNLYCGNFADGTLHKIQFDADGNPTQKEAPIFAKAPGMKSCDGIFCDLKTDKIYVADSMANAVQVVSPDGTVQTLAQNAESDGAGGQLDQPSELLIRGNQLIIANMDFPVPGGVNTTWDKPYTISVIDLD